MIKITFEIDEAFIRKQADPEHQAVKNVLESPRRFAKSMRDFISFCHLEKMIDEGQSEFVIPTDGSKDFKYLYDQSIGDICSLAMFYMTFENHESKTSKEQES